jgi:hypothetical protein
MAIDDRDINKNPMAGLNADEPFDVPTQAPVEGAEILPVKVKSELVGDIENKFHLAKSARDQDEQRWLSAYHNFRGIYGKNVKFRDNEKSRVFVKVTKAKVNAAYGQIVDVLFGGGKFPISINSTGVPEGIAEYAQIRDEAPTKEQPVEVNGNDIGYKGDGKTLAPGSRAGNISFLGDLEEKYTSPEGDMLFAEGFKDPAAPTIKPAEEAAAYMEKLILDEIDESDGSIHIRDAIFECVLLGSGCIKGPFNYTKTLNRWELDEESGERVYAPEKKTVPRIEYTSVWNVFPDPDATTLSDAGWVIEKHKLNKIQLHNLKDRPYFNEENIDKAISLGTNYVDEDYELEIRSENSNQSSTSDRYQVLEYWGTVDKEFAIEAGLDLEVETDSEEIQINAWVCNGEILRIVLNPFQPYRIPYNLFYYERNPYSIFGIGIPENMSDSQAVMNGHARMAIDNLALSGSTIFDIDESALVSGQSMEIYPGKIFKRQSGMPGQAVHGIKFPNTTIENMQMFDKFRQLADETTGIPSYSHGQTGVQSTTRTAAGMSMLMGAASLNIKTVIRGIDDLLLRPLGEAYYNWNFQFYKGSLPIRGDLEVRADGTSSLMQKEVKAQRLTQLLQTAANPAVAPFVKLPNIVKEIVKTMDLSAEDFVSTEEEAMIYATIIGKQNQMMQGNPPEQQIAGTPSGEAPPPERPGAQGFSGTPRGAANGE